MRVPYLFILLALLLSNCKPSYEEPNISLEGYEISDGFDLEVIASEPLLKAPVAIDFDLKGRIWVVEMTGFMLDVHGSGEEEPTGTIKILQDLDADGIVDHSKIVLDSLVLPRALALVYGGLLYAEPPNLWFAELENDKVVNRILVDSLYAVDGNPEHQPNGLLLHIDNWIYSAASTSRYQRRNGKWFKQPTSYRGQWGITNDNFGRLYYNNNATQLMGDYMLPNRVIRDSFFVSEKITNQVLTVDQKVYPINGTPVNRGYQEGVLDVDSLLINVTSACGPLVYRGGAFGKEYENNVFVCVPEANLIKRNKLKFNEVVITAVQARKGKEYLAATDEGFRPVDLTNGPDGNLYLVDMHRGILQHYAFLTPYLKAKSIEKGLDTIVNSGRILRISKSGNEKKESIDWEHLSDFQLVALLKHQNGWVRDRAQHLLVYQKRTKVISDLEKLVLENNSPIPQLHALYALQGLSKLKMQVLTEVALSSSPDLSAHAIVLLEEYVDETHIEKIKTLFQKLLARNDKTIDLYLISTLGSWASVNVEVFMPMIRILTEKYRGNPIYEEALMSGAGFIHDELKLEINKLDSGKSENLQNMLNKTLERKSNGEINSIFKDNTIPMDSRTNGARLFSKICAACHSLNGEGIYGLAPPLINSEYIADTKQLALIILHGIKGPISVNGKHYVFNGAMTGLADNGGLENEDFSDLINYVTNAFYDRPHQFSKEEIQKFRDIKPKNGEFTVDELNQVSSKNME